MSCVRLLLSLALGSLLAMAQESSLPYPPEFAGAQVETYKTIGDARLNLYIFNPPESGTKRAAIVFFFGGGWKAGSPAQFEMQCRRLASLGMVAIAADYRVNSRNHTTALDAVRDAKSAIRYVRENSARLGIDPQRIAAAGGSAGGHLAACTGIIAGLDEPGENRAVSSRPNALVLFNPVVVLAPTGDENVAQTLPADPMQGVDTASISPWHHVAGAPPTIIFHGKADTTVPFATVESFTKKMQAAGNRCDLIGYDGQKHGFFNYRAGGNGYYDHVLRTAEEFLASLGYLNLK